jgi:hypothetical protein
MHVECGVVAIDFVQEHFCIVLASPIECDNLIDACACAVAARDSNARPGGDEVDSRGWRIEIND